MTQYKTHQRCQISLPGCYVVLDSSGRFSGRSTMELSNLSLKKLNKIIDKDKKIRLLLSR